MSTETPKVSCSTCEYYQQIEDKPGMGLCIANPPQLLTVPVEAPGFQLAGGAQRMGIAVMPFFPQMDGDKQVCGAHQDWGDGPETVQ